MERLMASQTTESLLEQRAKTHGSYDIHANVTQEIKKLFRHNSSHDKFSDIQRESLDMIAHKLGRIIAGDPDFRDHWQDISGYAMLVAERCIK
jgi:hypothetical protein